jgi:hypothetical protein
LWAVLFAKHLFLKQLYPWSYFSPPLTKTWVGIKLKKGPYPSSLPHFSQPSINKVIGETVLPNNFFQNSSASPIKLLMKLFFKK